VCYANNLSHVLECNKPVIMVHMGMKEVKLTNGISWLYFYKLHACLKIDILSLQIKPQAFRDVASVAASPANLYNLCGLVVTKSF
jgi:hypothetical protein